MLDEQFYEMTHARRAIHHFPDDLLDDLTEATGGGLFQTESSSALEATFVRIIDEFRHRYLVSYSPTRVDAAGWHRLDVRVRPRGATVRARPGYFKERTPDQR